MKRAYTDSIEYLMMEAKIILNTCLLHIEDEESKRSEIVVSAITK